MREDLLSPGGGGSGEVRAVSKAGSLWQEGWMAVSSVAWSTGKAGAGGVTR